MYPAGFPADFRVANASIFLNLYTFIVIFNYQ
jgi:hypothetical protein